MPMKLPCVARVKRLMISNLHTIQTKLDDTPLTLDAALPKLDAATAGI